MSEVEVLKARVAELEGMLAIAAQEHRFARGQRETVVALLLNLRRYTRPEVAREAVTNASGEMGWWPNDHPTWRHVTPTYKVSEVIEYALRALEADR
jgi:hypothetical protein